jgi:hypothetical protein
MGDNSRPSLFVETFEAVINSAKVGGALSIPACFMLSYATLKSAIEDVLDIDLYNQELQAEEADSTKIIAVSNPPQNSSSRSNSKTRS